VCYRSQCQYWGKVECVLHCGQADQTRTMLQQCSMSDEARYPDGMFSTDSSQQRRRTVWPKMSEDLDDSLLASRSWLAGSVTPDDSMNITYSAVSCCDSVLYNHTAWTWTQLGIAKGCIDSVANTFFHLFYSLRWQRCCHVGHLVARNQPFQQMAYSLVPLVHLYNEILATEKLWPLYFGLLLLSNTLIWLVTPCNDLPQHMIGCWHSP
jgi:hypothetical protein